MCRKSKSGWICSYVGFVRKYPETLWLWVLLSIPVALFGQGMYSYSNRDFETQQVQKNIHQVGQTLGQWCQSDTCTSPKLCQSTIQWLEQYTQCLERRTFRNMESVHISSVVCIGLCNSHPTCNTTSECMNTCIYKWDIALKSIRDHMETWSYGTFFILGLIATVIWIVFCIGSFAEYEYYVRRLEEDERLKCV